MKAVIPTLKLFWCFGMLGGCFWLLRTADYAHYETVVLAMIAALIAAVVVSAFTLAQSPDTFKELLREFSYFWHYSTAAWTISVAFATLATGAYLFLPHDKPHQLEHVDEAAKIYAEVLIACLGLHIFYRRTAPISDVDLLLILLRKDLRRQSSREARLLVAYPALNIGYYRAITGQKDDKASPFSNYAKFREEFQAAITNPNRYANATALTYPRALYSELYAQYDKLAASTPSVSRVNSCVAEANVLAEDFVKNAQLVQINPQLFPPHIIVIGDVVYSIMSYGIPLYQPNSSKPDTADVFNGTFVGGEPDHVAQLVVYRREDDVLAGIVEDHIQRLIQRTKS